MGISGNRTSLNMSIDNEYEFFVALFSNQAER